MSHSAITFGDRVFMGAVTIGIIAVVIGIAISSTAEHRYKAKLEKRIERLEKFHDGGTP